MPTDKDILKGWLTDRSEALKLSQKQKGLYASGQSASVLSERVSENEESISGQLIDGSGSFYFQQHGRKPGKWPPRKAIIDWIRVKPIIPKGNISIKSLAFLISRKIATEGIKVPNQYNPGGVVSDVVNNQAIEQLKEQLSGYYVKEFLSDIVRTNGSDNN